MGLACWLLAVPRVAVWREEAVVSGEEKTTTYEVVVAEPAAAAWSMDEKEEADAK